MTRATMVRLCFNSLMATILSQYQYSNVALCWRVHALGIDPLAIPPLCFLGHTADAVIADHVVNLLDMMLLRTSFKSLCTWKSRLKSWLGQGHSACVTARTLIFHQQRDCEVKSYFALIPASRITCAQVAVSVLLRATQLPKHAAAPCLTVYNDAIEARLPVRRTLSKVRSSSQ